MPQRLGKGRPGKGRGLRFVCRLAHSEKTTVTGRTPGSHRSVRGGWPALTEADRRSGILSLAGPRVSRHPDQGDEEDLEETHLGGELHLSVQGPGWTWPAWVAWDSSCEGHSGSLLLVGELGKWHVTRKSGSELFTLPDS